MDPASEIVIPEIVPVMTLQGTVLFPHAVMPLFIFEKRYREMLADVLSGHRLFAVFNEAEDSPEGHEEPPAVMGTVGMVRAAHKNADGTSNLALQGISRVRLLEIVRESPYRLIRVAPCQDADPANILLPAAQTAILDLIGKHPHLTDSLPVEYVDFLRSIDLPAPFIDVAAQALCLETGTKQRLLETLSLPDRFRLLAEYLQRECSRQDLFKQLQGHLPDEEIGKN